MNPPRTRGRPSCHAGDRRRLRPTFLLSGLIALVSLLAACGQPAAPDTAAGSQAGGSGGAVILLYHHVSATTPPSTSVTPEIFDAHLAHLAEHRYRVLPLSRIIDALRSGDALPERAVAITFDDAYASVFSEAAPRLERHGFPYTIFVSTDYIDRGYRNYLTWDQLRALEAAGAEIANHSRNHGHYVHRPASESRRAWRARIGDDIRHARQRLAAELDRPIDALAYPYGEFTPELEALAADLGYTGFGQQSGAVGRGSNLQSLARFPMAAGYADLKDFAEKLRTRAFMVEVLSPADPVLAATATVSPDADAPTLRLRLDAPHARLDALACFVTGQPAPAVNWVDRAAGIVEVTARQPLPTGRSKYTCTAPATDADGVFYWYSHLWMTPPAPGEWHAD